MEKPVGFELAGNIGVDAGAVIRDDGEYVKYADHAAKVAELEREIERLKKLSEASERWRLAYQVLTVLVLQLQEGPRSPK